MPSKVHSVQVVGLKTDIIDIKVDLSARSYHRIIKLARTIAYLGGASDIDENHIIEALQYRPKQQLF